MGLTNNSVGIKAVNYEFSIKKQNENDKVIALAGNPNVGKSTVFNNLTGMNQHTGNWPGKTVVSAQGYCSTSKNSYVFVDIPGTYSLMAHSAEEEVARNFICFGEPDVIVVVCDATCLERNLNLALQIMEVSSNVLICINLMDEAKRKNIKININELSKKLGVPVVGVTARKKKTLDKLKESLDVFSENENKQKQIKVTYDKPIEEAISLLMPILKSDENLEKKINLRWLALKLIENDKLLIKELKDYIGENLFSNTELISALENINFILNKEKINSEVLKDKIVFGIVKTVEKICKGTVLFENNNYNETDRKIDKILTNKISGYPIMLMTLALIFWLTISGANYPSQLLSKLFFTFQDKLTALFIFFNAPKWLHGAIVLGVYRTLAWVVSVMLPPMAIFFPLFTLLEDLGYLPRVAYNLDKHFKKCCTCGKQALTMCMVIIILL